MSRAPMTDGLTPVYRGLIAGLRPIIAQVTVQDWQGGEHIPTTGGCVIACNHISYVDPFTLAHFIVDQGRAPRFLAKSALFKPPVVRQVMTGSGQIPVYRGTTRAVDALGAALQAIREGACVCVLPEGTLTRDPRLWPMTGKTGAARIALQTGCPLVPVGMWGTQEVLWPYRDKVPSLLPRHTIKVYAGDPVDLSDLRQAPVTGAVLRTATARLMDAITALVARARGEQPPADRFDPRHPGGRGTE